MIKMQFFVAILLQLPRQPPSLKEMAGVVKDAAAALESVVTVVAIVVGGIWTYRAFIRSRGNHPRAKIEHQVSFRGLPNGSQLLILDVFIENVGQIPISLRGADTWVQQILPLPADVQARIDNGLDVVAEGMTEARWTLLGEVHEQEYAENLYVIDAAERDQFRHNFTLGPEVHTVQVYTYLKPTGMGPGWKLKSTYDIPRSAEQSRPDEKATTQHLPEVHRERAAHQKSARSRRDDDHGIQ